MALAMHEKECDEQDKFRTLRADIINFAGMGAKKAITPEQLQEIPLIDNKNLILPIRNEAEALKLLKEFEEAWQSLK